MQLFFNWCHKAVLADGLSSFVNQGRAFWVPTALAMKPDNWISSILTKKTYFTPFVTKSFKSNPVILFLLLLRRGVFFHLKSYNPYFDMVYFRSWLDFSGLNSLWLWRKFDTTELQNENDYFGKYVWERDLFGGGVEVASLNIFVGIYMTRNTALYHGARQWSEKRHVPLHEATQSEFKVTRLWNHLDLNQYLFGLTIVKFCFDYHI